MTSMEEPPRAIPRWVKALILMVTLVGVGVGTATCLRTSAGRAWTSMQVKTRALDAEAKARPAARPVLRGTPEPGNAWTDYDLALNDLAAHKNEVSRITEFVSRDPKVDRAAVDRFLASKTGAIDNLRRGARRAEGAYPYDWDLGPGRLKPSIQLSNGLARLAVAQARVLHEAGRTREAADLLLDLLQFGGDHRRNMPVQGDAIGASLCGLAIDELKDLLLSGKLKADDLSDLAGPLEILDRDWPDYATSLRNEATVMLVALGTEDFKFLGGDPAMNVLRAWQHGFSMRRMAADAADEIVRYTERAIGHEALPWIERLKAQEELKRDVERAANLFVKLVQPGVGRFGSYERSPRAKLRLLRFAIHYMMTGGMADLDDPFGSKLRHQEVDGKLRIWSLGRDGVDQDGVGDWKRDVPPADIILEIPK